MEIKSGHGLVVECDLPKVETRVRFPVPAQVSDTNFTRMVENFTCEHCGASVIGNGYTNHCPKCLWSKHVDVHPGDRAAGCGGPMEPVRIEDENGESILTHRCVKCDHEKRNKLAQEDEYAKVVAVAKAQATRWPS